MRDLPFPRPLLGIAIGIVAFSGVLIVVALLQAYVPGPYDRPGYRCTRVENFDTGDRVDGVMVTEVRCTQYIRKPLPPWEHAQ